MFAAQNRINLVALILRLGLAVIFLYHGLDKIINGTLGTTWVGDMYTHRPEPVPTSLTFTSTQLAVAWGEFLGGIALLVGLLTRLAAVGLIIIQVGAIWLVTAPRGFSFDKGGGYEYNLALVAMCLALLILGAGALSVDELLARQRRKTRQRVAVTVPPLAGPHVASGQPVEQASPGQPQPM
jgi:putative oxidoreductase